jgi:predicted nucleic acid-binding protein
MFLDANVVLEILLSRKQEAAARKLIDNSTGRLYMSVLTAHLIVQFGQAIVDLPILRQFLADYTILNLESPDFRWAFANVRGNDFEDGLQLAVAIRNGCTRFVTFDRDLAATYASLTSIQVELAG